MLLAAHRDRRCPHFAHILPTFLCTHFNSHDISHPCDSARNNRRRPAIERLNRALKSTCDLQNSKLAHQFMQKTNARVLDLGSWEHSTVTFPNESAAGDAGWPTVDRSHRTPRKSCRSHSPPSSRCCARTTGFGLFLWKSQVEGDNRAERRVVMWQRHGEGGEGTTVLRAANLSSLEREHRESHAVPTAHLSSRCCATTTGVFVFQNRNQSNA